MNLKEWFLYRNSIILCTFNHMIIKMVRDFCVTHTIHMVIHLISEVIRFPDVGFRGAALTYQKIKHV